MCDKCGIACDKSGNEVNEEYLFGLLKLWVLRAQLAAKAHYEQTTIFHRKNLSLTIVNAIATIGVLFSRMQVGLKLSLMGKMVLVVFGSLIMKLP